MKKLILILSEPRTGSNILSESLNLYEHMRSINEFFLFLGHYVREDFVPDDLPHKTLLRSNERYKLFESLNVEQENYPALLKAINKDPYDAFYKIYEIVKYGTLVIKIHSDHMEQLNLYDLLDLPYVEVILLERSNRLKSYVSLLKARQFDQWHNVDTSNLKVHVDIEKFRQEKQRSLDWYKKIRLKLASKNYLEINYEKDLENVNNEHLYSIFDPWFEKINMSVTKKNYKLTHFNKQNRSPIEDSISNYDEIKNFL